MSVYSSLKKIGKNIFSTDYRLFPKGKGIVISKSLKVGKYSIFKISNKKTQINIAESVEFRAYCNVLVEIGATLTIGKNVFFNNNCSINCLGYIRVGQDTIFGENVKLYDHNHKYSFDSFGKLNIEKNDFKVGEILIGDNCWIGSNVTILNNVEIGDNVIIGANCLIIKSIPSNTIVKHLESLTITDNQ